MPSSLRTVVEGLDHPEAVCWDPRLEMLYAGGEAGQVYRFSLEGREAEVAARVEGGVIAGLAVDGTGTIYACDVANGCVQRIECDGRVERFGEPMRFPNYPAFDNQGVLWVSDSGAWTTPTGSLVRIEPDGKTQRVETRALAFPNGLAIHGEWVYVAESASATVSRVPLAGGDVQVVVRLQRAIPDGLAFDSDHGLWIACFQPNRIYRRFTTGVVEIVIEDWSGMHLLTPTNIAFAGRDLTTVAVASLGGTAIRAFTADVAGAALHHPRCRASADHQGPTRPAVSAHWNAGDSPI